MTRRDLKDAREELAYKDEKLAESWSQLKEEQKTKR